MESLLYIVNSCPSSLFCSTAQIPLYLYPFLNTVSRHRPFEYLRLTSLGVIGALVKVMQYLVKIAVPSQALSHDASNHC